MSANLPSDFCPYKGLQPYTEQDRTFFFGRDRDQQIVISNLYAAQLTVLYGASGVGKSSVLLAGSVPLLKQERNLSVIVFRSWQDPEFLQQLKEQTLATVSARSGKQLSIDLTLPLDEFLVALSRAARGLIFFVFDQFEEYFLYNPTLSDARGFEAEFARAVNRRDINANFLLSMREDSLSKLDRFQGRIPTLMTNMLRLEHLDRNAAREAIIRPLEQYNKLTNTGLTPITIEPPLVKAILDDLEGAKPVVDQLGQGALATDVQENAKSPIETPFLQMVLTRLWNEERGTGSHALRLQTFDKLGRAANIARTHLDTMMAKLTDQQRVGAAEVLRYLVTPSGSKIAQEAGALTSWTELKKEQVEEILNRLSGPDMRILRTMQAPGQPMRYEIFHDVLAQAVLNWRRRYVAYQDQERIRQEEQARRDEELEKVERLREKERSQRLRRAIVALSIIMMLMAGLMAFAFWQMYQAKKARDALTAKVMAEYKRQQDVREAGIHIRNGQNYLQRKKYADAISEFDEAIKLDPYNPSPFHQKGYAYLRANQLADAIKTLQDLTTKIDPSYALGHFTLALAYQLNGDNANALKEARTTLDVNPAYCENFRKDLAYAWFVNSRDYEQRCVRNY